MNQTFNYFNPNPTVKFDKKTGRPKKWHKGDCVIRAFCCALNKSWDEVFMGLCKIAAKQHDMPNADKVVEEYANENGMVKTSLIDYMRVRAFAEYYDGVYVVRVRGHMACVKNNQINDCWDCGRYQMKTYYTLLKK